MLSREARPGSVLGSVLAGSLRIPRSQSATRALGPVRASGLSLSAYGEASLVRALQGPQA
jgi:hypothetical protein